MPNAITQAPTIPPTVEHVRPMSCERHEKTTQAEALRDSATVYRDQARELEAQIRLDSERIGTLQARQERAEAQRDEAKAKLVQSQRWSNDLADRANDLREMLANERLTVGGQECDECDGEGADKLIIEESRGAADPHARFTWDGQTHEDPNEYPCDHCDGVGVQKPRKAVA